MNNNDVLFKNFLENAILLNQFNIYPLLYGSLGLQQLLKDNLNPDDIDVLIPEVYIKDRWDEFKEYLESFGYELIDLHEHTFKKDDILYSYASIDSLESFAGIQLNDIEVLTNDTVIYRVLNLSQYLSVYRSSSKDGYRINKREKKDYDKIKLIENSLMGRTQ